MFHPVILCSHLFSSCLPEACVMLPSSLTCITPRSLMSTASLTWLSQTAAATTKPRTYLQLTCLLSIESLISSQEFPLPACLLPLRITYSRKQRVRHQNHIKLCKMIPVSPCPLLTSTLLFSRNSSSLLIPPLQINLFKQLSVVCMSVIFGSLLQLNTWQLCSELAEPVRTETRLWKVSYNDQCSIKSVC